MLITTISLYLVIGSIVAANTAMSNNITSDVRALMGDGEESLSPSMLVLGIVLMVLVWPMFAEKLSDLLRD